MAASSEVIPIQQFFSKLNFIINIVGVSYKRHDELQAAQAAELELMIAIKQVETGRGLN